MKMIISTILVAIFLINLSSSTADETPWNYEKVGDYGPGKWGQKHTQCKSTATAKQSPINIEASNTKYDLMTLFEMNDAYKRNHKKQFVMKNNGHTIVMSPIDGQENKTIHGGDLKHKYKFAQLHMHWGNTNDEGSEHYIDGKASPLEIHLVHYNMDQYKDIGEALPHHKGLAVIGVIVEIGKSSPVFEKLKNVISKIQHKGQGTNIEDNLSLMEFLPSDIDAYYRYIGSLTTPPCSESVIWTLMKHRLTISEEQMAKIRGIYSTEEGSNSAKTMSGNKRPLQELNGREITMSFSNGSDLRSSLFVVVLSLVPLMFHCFSNQI